MVALAALGTAAPAHADATLVVTTPYPSIEAQPGSDVKLGLAVTSAAPDVVEPRRRRSAGRLDRHAPRWWLRHPLHHLQPDTGATADLEIAVPPDAVPWRVPHYRHRPGRVGRAVGSRHDLVVADVVNNGISLTADFPSLSGDPGTAFAYNLKVTNDTPIEQTFTFDPTAPQGWAVTANPTAQEKAQTVTVDAGPTRR